MRQLSPGELNRIESLHANYPSISTFLTTSKSGDWISVELEKARNKHDHHMLLEYLADWGNIIARRFSEMFEVVLAHILEQRPKLRRKLRSANTQVGFESVWFELEIASILLDGGYRVEIEPLGKKGPDFKTSILEHEVFLEAKRLQIDAETRALSRNNSDIVEQLKEYPYPVPVHIYLTLHDRYPGEFDRQRLITRIHEAVKELYQSGRLSTYTEYIGEMGRIVASARIHQLDKGTTEVFESWVRSIDPAKEAWEWSERYFPGDQFPEEGLHVLVVDAFWGRADSLIDAWKSNQIPTSVDCLMLCPHVGGWLGDVKTGTVFLPNQGSRPPMPTQVLESLKRVFSNVSFVPIQG